MQASATTCAATPTPAISNIAPKIACGVTSTVHLIRTRDALQGTASGSFDLAPERLAPARCPERGVTGRRVASIAGKACDGCGDPGHPCTMSACLRD
jgi:hypothetical protein